ncbi:MAG: hypothetical protein JWM33_249 [Caulobacteraceae bacterium]|nr:hypothetical protein [Caulobacteraceae bacterium]
MRTQADNPAYQRFRYLLPADGLYPARWVDIFSNSDDSLRYYDVEVVFVPRGNGAPELDRAFWDAFADYNRHWMGDLGNSVAGWMQPHGLNPAKVFAMMLVYGFVNQEELNNALHEFSYIKECNWAREMVGGLMADVLIDGAQNRGAILNALEHKARRERWAADMLAIMRDEAEF